MNWDETRDFLSPCFPECIRDELAMLLPGELREIRIRAERPAVFVTATRTAKLDWIPGQMQVEALTEALSGHSLFARASTRMTPSAGANAAALRPSAPAAAPPAAGAWTGAAPPRWTAAPRKSETAGAS